jgi:hypothetical protein
LHTATLLPSGKVLVVGGFGSATLVTAEVYDEAIGAWTAAGSLATARYSHTATSLPSGKVLVAGGHIDSGIPVASAELYDERTGTWTTTGSLATPREYHAATRLRSGKVLVAGGRGSGIVNAVSLASAELYDEAMGAWTPTGSLANARHYHTTTLLRSGKVLVAGGYDLSTFSSLASAELYDETGIWTLTGSLFTERHYHTATLVPSGGAVRRGDGHLGRNDPTLHGARLARGDAAPLGQGSRHGRLQRESYRERGVVAMTRPLTIGAARQLGYL